MRDVGLVALAFLAPLCAVATPGNLLQITSVASAQELPQSQRPEPPGTIRVRVSLIPVDVIVTGKDGKPVAGLKKEDFAILEDGRPQEIMHFSIQALKPEPDASRERPVLRQIPTLELAPQSARTFLMVLGRGRHQSAFKGVDALIRFVRNDLLPQDRVAVVAYNRATDFTTDRQVIIEVLERYKKVHEQIETWADLRYGGLGAVYGSKEIPKSWQPEIDRIFDVAGQLEYRKVPPGRVTEEGKMVQDSATVTNEMLSEEARRGLRDRFSQGPLAGLGRAGAGGVFDRLSVTSVTDLSFAEYVSTAVATHQDVQNLFTSIEYLRYMEGEKHLLFFTENGLFLPRLEYDMSIAGIANDARVAIDTFQTGGIGAGTLGIETSAGGTETSMGSPVSRTLSREARGLSWSRSMALDSLRNVAELTGGRASLRADIGKALTRINESTRLEYLLGYYPEGTTWDGKYRRITVKVNRPGLNLSYRHGYFARDRLQPRDRQEFLAFGRISAAAAYEPQIGDIPFKVSTAWQKNTAGERQTRADLVIDASRVRFHTVGGLHSARLRIAIFYTDSDGRYLGDVWENLDLDLKEETYQKAMQEGIRHSVLIAIRPGRRLLKTIVYDCAGDRIGSLITRLN